MALYLTQFLAYSIANLLDSAFPCLSFLLAEYYPNYLRANKEAKYVPGPGPCLPNPNAGRSLLWQSHCKNCQMFRSKPIQVCFTIAKYCLMLFMVQLSLPKPTASMSKRLLMVPGWHPLFLTPLWHCALTRLLHSLGEL